MSLFMRNLIARHREPSADSGPVALVRPRPKARFESDLGPTGISGSSFENENAVTLSGDSEQRALFLQHNDQPDRKFFPPRPSSDIEATEGVTRKHALSEQGTPLPALHTELRVDPPEEVSRQLSDQSGVPGERAAAQARTGVEEKEYNRPEKQSAFADQQTRRKTFHAKQKEPSQKADAESRKSRRNNVPKESAASESASEQQSLLGTGEFKQQLQTIQQRLNTRQFGPVDEQATHYPGQSLGQDRQLADNAYRKTEEVQFEQPRTEEKTGRGEPSFGDFNQSIQEILLRLNTQQEQQKGAAEENAGLQDKPISLDIETTILPESSETAPKLISPPTGAVPGQLGDERKEPEAHPLQPEPLEIQQSGLLQPPPWLTKMRADSFRRNQEETSQTQASPEPVINVTIGRVEVRATRTPFVSKPEKRQRPSGVMSLDEYLKQRENRG